MSSFATSCSLAALLAFVAGGCGGPAPPETPEPAGPAPTPTATSTLIPGAAPLEALCLDGKDCHQAGMSSLAAGDRTAAAAHFERGCTLGSAISCFAVAEIEGTPAERQNQMYGRACDLDLAAGCYNVAETLRGKDDTRALALYEKACEGFEKDGDVPDEKRACVRGAEYAYSLGQHATAIEIAKHACDASATDTCGLLGVMFAKGQGTAQDVKQAKAYLGTACKAGDQEACINDKKLDDAVAAAATPASGGLDVPGANVSVGSMTVDGLTVTDLACKAGGGLGALLAGPAMAGALAKKKAALKACSSTGTARVRWTAAGGKVTKAESKAATPKIEACIVKAVTASTPPMDATCAATIELGK